MIDQKLAIPIDKIKDDFQSFLTPNNNKRIIFSGPFGIGKTYFLNEYFKEKEEEYYPIFLRPINYSLLSNEDVFKFIKYDILSQIIKDQYFVIDNEFDFTKTEYLSYFFKENRFLILKNFLKAFPKIRNVVSAAEDFEKLVEKYNEGLEQINESTELKMLKTFQEDSESNFLLENDEVSAYISNKLDELIEKKKNGNIPLKKVLIVDDLDRLDPEHIFRLFNVFSAHFDQVNYYEDSDNNEENKNDNKFGFDKIIFVCDIDNIRKIFAHKYGSEVDFSGYIDKFYSSNIFHLFHQNIFENIISPYLENKLRITNSQQKRDFKLILKFLYEGRQINIRDIIRLNEFKPSFLSSENKFIRLPIFLTKVGSKENTFLNDYSLLISLKLLLDLFGAKDILVHKIKRALLIYNIRELANFSFEYLKLVPQLLLFAGIDQHKFQVQLLEEDDPKEYEYENLSVKIKYRIDGSYYERHYREGEMWFNARNIDPNIQLNSGQLYSLFHDAALKIFEKGILD